MKKLSTVLGIIVLLMTMSLSAQAQEIVITPASSKEFKPGELRTLIREAAFEALGEFDVPRQVFDKNYPAMEEILLEKSRPVLVKKFKWVEYTGSHNNREVYRKELYRGIRDVLFDDGTFRTLYNLDQSDRILSYYSDIVVRKDGWIHVTEHITIFNGDGSQNAFYRDAHPNESSSINNDIQHGLVRDFPTQYTHANGLNVTVAFVIRSITRNGQPENFSTESLNNGTRIKMGNAASYLEKGVHEYVLQFDTKHQLIFHPGKDELYWNVNGTGWVFTADTVHCQITFPATSKIIEQACYTGQQGSTAQNCTYTLLNDSTIHFAARGRLDQYEGLTVAAAIHKGVLVSPSSLEENINLVQDNWPIPAMLLVLISMFTLNFLTWKRVGKDPVKGTIVPQFDPPPGISPADAGFIYKQRYKPEHFSAALVDIAVRKGIRIDVENEGLIFKTAKYTFLPGDDDSSRLKSYVSQSYGWSLSGLYNVEASKTYNPTVASLSGELNGHLSSQFQTDYAGYSGKRGFFAWNTAAGFWGFILLAVLGFAALMVVPKHFTALIVGIIVALFVVAFAMQYIFYKIMPAYNAEGRKMLDYILGLRMYLVTAEERRFNALAPPERTLELFERLLPYAIALECQHEWSDKFEKILEDAIARNEYTPHYYSGHFNNFSSMSSGISSGLSSTIASASTAPSSSSGGSSGGGSSGGGGGGGGGGGW